MIENFRYNDIILYCKGHLIRKDIVKSGRIKVTNDDIIKDLGYLFSEIYGLCNLNESDIAYFMLRALDVYYEKAGIMFDSETKDRNFATMHQDINNFMRFDSLNYNQACIRWVVSIFRWKIDMSTIKLNPYHYGKNKLFRARGPISMTYTEMNDRHQKLLSKNNTKPDEAKDRQICA